MKKHNLLTLLILVTSVLTGTVKAFGYAEVEQAVTLSVQPSVSISKTESSESDSINPETGKHGGLKASFLIQVNGTDSDYDFIVNSKMNTSNGEVPAFTNSGNLMFAHTMSYPTSEAIEDARTEGSQNRNIIVYPVTMSITSPMTVNFLLNNATYGNCYQVKVNTGTTGTLTNIVGELPVGNTYSPAQDEFGTYQSTVYFTAIQK